MQRDWQVLDRGGLACWGVRSHEVKPSMTVTGLTGCNSSAGRGAPLGGGKVLAVASLLMTRPDVRLLSAASLNDRVMDTVGEAVDHRPGAERVAKGGKELTRAYIPHISRAIS